MLLDFDMMTRVISCRPDQESDSEAEDSEHAEKLRQVKAVLEEVHLRSFLFSLIQDSGFSLFWLIKQRD